jgi:hypothetical protein
MYRVFLEQSVAFNRLKKFATINEPEVSTPSSQKPVSVIRNVITYSVNVRASAVFINVFTFTPILIGELIPH